MAVPKIGTQEEKAILGQMLSSVWPPLGLRDQGEIQGDVQLAAGR